MKAFLGFCFLFTALVSHVSASEAIRHFWEGVSTGVCQGLVFMDSDVRCHVEVNYASATDYNLILNLKMTFENESFNFTITSCHGSNSGGTGKVCSRETGINYVLEEPLSYGSQKDGGHLGGRIYENQNWLDFSAVEHLPDDLHFVTVALTGPLTGNKPASCSIRTDR